MKEDLDTIGGWFHSAKKADLYKRVRDAIIHRDGLCADDAISVALMALANYADGDCSGGGSPKKHITMERFLELAMGAADSAFF